MLEQLLAYLKNWFLVDKHPGTYTIESGGIALPFLKPGQYFRIMGSVFNDGLYIYGDTIKDGDGNDAELVDETFTGSVWALAVPKVIRLISKQKAETDAKITEITGEFIKNPFTSESYMGVYSYSKDYASQLSALKEQAIQIIGQLSQYRKLMED